MSSSRQARALLELASRRQEALRLFRPTPEQIPFFRCSSKETLVLGGNRSGKSTVAAVKFAAIATDRPVITSEGAEIECRLPHQKGHPLTMWLVGINGDHIGQTLHRLLFRPGSFKMIRDLGTGDWRTYRPWDKSDKDRISEVKPAPPLIPPRFINPNSWGWEDKRNKTFKSVEIWDPTTHEVLANIYAFSSGGDVKAGDSVDLVLIDEAVRYPEYLAEWRARLIDRDGRLIWASWPDISNDSILNMSRRADEQEDDPNPVVRKFVFRMSANKYLPQEAVEAAISEWSPEERRARDLGEFVSDTLRMYPRFDAMVHTAIAPEGASEDRLSEALRQNHGEPPADWTRELILDPGTAHPAVLLCAIPPPELGDYMVPYHEIYIPRLDADGIADAVLSATQGQYFERFIIDPQAGRQTPMGFGHTIQKNYSRAFEERGLRAGQTGSSFTPGSNDVAGRILNLQSWMTIGKGGFPKLRIVTERCPQLCKQLVNYRKKMQSGDPLDFKPALGQRIDLAVCLEYWASRHPQWAKKYTSESRLSPAHREYLRIKKRMSSRKASKKLSGSVSLGPISIN